jgi:hypothetical protein
MWISIYVGRPGETPNDQAGGPPTERAPEVETRTGASLRSDGLDVAIAVS